MTLLEDLMLEDFCLDDDIEMSPKEVFAYLNRVIYNRRTKCVSCRNCARVCTEHVQDSLRSALHPV